MDESGGLDPESDIGAKRSNPEQKRQFYTPIPDFYLADQRDEIDQKRAIEIKCEAGRTD